MSAPRRIVGGAAAVAGVTAALVGLLLRPWSGGWGTPVVYRSDTLATLAMVDAAGWTGTARAAPGLGAPHGTEWFDFPLGPDRLHLVVLRLLRLVVGDSMTALNLYLVLGFVLVAVVAFGVLSHLGVPPVLAGALGVVFSLAPYHFDRLDSGHAFLAAYYAVPLGVLLALWAADGSLAGPDARRRRWGALALVLVVGSASAYYAAFSILLVAGLGLAVAVRRGSWRVLLVPAAVALGIGSVVVLNVAGDLMDAAGRGPNPEAVARAPGDSDWYGLRPMSMVTPPSDHRVAAMAALGTTYESAVPRRGGSYLGLVALAGLVVVAVGCVRPAAVPDGSLARRLGVMVGVCVLAGSVGGGAVALAASGFGQIRVWDRVTVVVGFLGLVGLGSALGPWWRARPPSARTTPALVAVALVAVAVLDQVGAAMPSRTANRVARAGDAEVAASMQQSLGSGDTVLQFPYVAFPGGVTDRGLPQYAHLGPWAAGDGTLSYSAGAMQGRGGDWQASWLAQDPRLLVGGAAAAGFDALYVDLRATPAAGLQTTPRSGRELADALDALGLPSQRSADGSRRWFDLRPLQERLGDELGRATVDRLGRGVVRPIGVTFSGAATYTAAPAGVRLLDPVSTVTLRREDGDTGSVRVRFAVEGEPGATVEVTAPGVHRRVRLGDDPTGVDLTVPMVERDVVVEVRTDATLLPTRPRSAPDARLQLSNLTVIDTELDDRREQLRLSNS